MENKSELVEFAADIVAAYVGNNSVPATELPNLINDVIRALNGAVSTGGEVVVEEARPRRTDQEIGDAGLHHLSRGWKEVQVAETPSAHPL
jgi:predicted transcriptional regulator